MQVVFLYTPLVEMVFQWKAVGRDTKVCIYMYRITWPTLHSFCVLFRLFVLRFSFNCSSALTSGQRPVYLVCGADIHVPILNVQGGLESALEV